MVPAGSYQHFCSNYTIVFPANYKVSIRYVKTPSQLLYWNVSMDRKCGNCTDTGYCSNDIYIQLKD